MVADIRLLIVVLLGFDYDSSDFGQVSDFAPEELRGTRLGSRLQEKYTCKSKTGRSSQLLIRASGYGSKCHQELDHSRFPFSRQSILGLPYV